MLVYKEEQLGNLIEKFLSGDEGVFSEIAKLIHEDILNIAYRYVANLEDAKDILQEVLLKIYRQVRFFRGSSKFSTWLYRITVNTSVDFLRKRKNRLALQIKSLQDKKVNISTEDKEECEKKFLVQEAMQKLPLRQKNVFILKHYQGFTIEEISKILGCSISTVKTHLLRGIDNLRKNMEVKL
jgi:RNA polymerase sigma-70 factor (ECF subfamily)